MRKKILSLAMVLSCFAVSTVNAQDTDPSEVAVSEVSQEVSVEVANDGGDSRLNMHGEGCGCSGKPKA